MKYPAKFKFFLGIEFGRSDKGIYMYQRKYALELIVELGLSSSNAFATPLEVNRKLTYVEYDNIIENEGISISEIDKLRPNPKVYQRLIGRLLYLTITRPSISFNVHTLGQYMYAPMQSHMEVAIKVVRYIKSTPGQGLLMLSIGKRNLLAYCDTN